MSEHSFLRQGGSVALVETNGTVRFETIERLTTTQIILTNSRRFNRRLCELASDNGTGHKTNRGARLVDPADSNAVVAYARQLLRAFANEAQNTTYGAAATLYTLSLEQVREEFNRLADLVNSSLEELDRRVGL